MDATRESEPAPMKNGTTVERKSEHELVVTRSFTARRTVFEAWTKTELLKRWWAPKSMGVSLLSWRGGCACGRQVPFRIRPRGSSKPWHSSAGSIGSDAARAPCLVWTTSEK